MSITETTPKQAIEGCIRKLHEITAAIESVFSLCRNGKEASHE